VIFNLGESWSIKMEDKSYYKRVNELKKLQAILAMILNDTNSVKDLKFVNNLLRKFPTRKSSKLLRTSEKQLTVLKGQIKDLYLSGQTTNPSFIKAISMLNYITQIEENNLNSDKFRGDVDKINKESTRRFFAEEEDLKKIKKQEMRKSFNQENLKRRKEIQTFTSKYSNLVTKFFDFTNSKVSIIDENGQPSWTYLYIEIAKFISNLYREEGRHMTNNSMSLFHRTRNPEVFVKPYSYIAQYLDREFRKQFDLNKISEKNPNNLTGIDFEGYVALLLRKIGITNIIGTPVSGDQGADLLFKIGPRKIAIQVKRHSKPIGNYAVQEIVGALRYYDADDGWVITNSTFTPSAEVLAQKNDVLLIDGQKLSDLKTFLESSYKYSAFLKTDVI